MDERRATVGGSPMRWLDHGSGFPVVLVHGIPTSPELWRDVMPRIHGRTLAWEMVGYGESMETGIGRDISLARQAGYLADWLGDLRLPRVLLVGHDVGGGVVQILAVRRPELAAGIVLTNSVGYDNWPVPSVRAARAMRGLIRRLPPKLVAAVLRRFFLLAHAEDDAGRASAAIHAARYARPGGARAFARQLASLNAEDTIAIADRLPALGCPAAVAWGVGDPFLDLRWGERFARDLAAPLEQLHGARHYTPEDRPAAVAAAVNAVLARVV